MENAMNDINWMNETDQQTGKERIEEGGCPFCGGSDIEWGEYRDFNRCIDCDRSWQVDIETKVIGWEEV